MKTLGYKGIRVLYQKNNENNEIKGPWRRTIPPIKDRENKLHEGTSNGEDLSTPDVAKASVKQLAFRPAWMNSTSICICGLILYMKRCHLHSFFIWNNVVFEELLSTTNLACGNFTLKSQEIHDVASVRPTILQWCCLCETHWSIDLPIGQLTLHCCWISLWKFSPGAWSCCSFFFSFYLFPEVSSAALYLLHLIEISCLNLLHL